MKLKKRKLFYLSILSIGITPILISPLLLTSCSDYSDWQNSSGNNNANDNTNNDSNNDNQTAKDVIIDQENATKLDNKCTEFFKVQTSNDTTQLSTALLNQLKNDLSFSDKIKRISIELGITKDHEHKTARVYIYLDTNFKYKLEDGASFNFSINVSTLESNKNFDTNIPK